MRMTVAWLMLATALPAQAQTGVRAPAALASGEVALHVVAHGETTTPADGIVVTTTVTGKGATATDADAATGAAVARVTAALIAAGVDRRAIVSATPAAGRSAPVVTFASPVPSGSASASPHSVPAATASATMTVTIGDRAGLDRVTRTLEAQGQSTTGKPTVSLTDPAPARRAAAVAAIARARSDADDYATALGMRVVRVVGVSNAAGLGDGIEEIADMVERFGNHSAAPDVVVTRATATVDYVLAPR